jgi:putative tricarboxylic transport membrane protein
VKRRRIIGLAAGLVSPYVSRAAPAPAQVAQCIVPAKSGGGFELTCKLVQQMLAGLKTVDLRFLPGGIGAVAYTTMVRERADEPSTLVAFSSGSLLNLAQGKFGPHTENDVRWLAVIGTDYGVIAVRRSSPLRSLRDVMNAIKSDPRTIVFGAGGTIGSQDWFKAALLARAAGVSHRAIRFVAFEGGGDALLALQGGHVSVFTGDAAEVAQFVGKGGDARVLAVLSEQRLPGTFAGSPNAKEQGVDLVWPTARGLYLGPKVSATVYNEWLDAVRLAMAKDSFGAQREAHGLYPMSLTGEELQSFIRSSMATYRRLVDEFALPRRPS